MGKDEHEGGEEDVEKSSLVSQLHTQTYEEWKWSDIMYLCHIFWMWCSLALSLWIKLEHVHWTSIIWIRGLRSGGVTAGEQTEAEICDGSDCINKQEMQFCRIFYTTTQTAFMPSYHRKLSPDVPSAVKAGFLLQLRCRLAFLARCRTHLQIFNTVM